MRIALGQINTTVGDIAGNEGKILDAYRRGAREHADLVVVPELSVTGYPPRDLLYDREFIEKNLAALNRLAAATGDTALLVGYAGKNANRPGREVTNSAAFLQHGAIQASRAKTLLPTYDVFDEDRYFEPATENHPLIIRGNRLGLTVCEDIWNDEDYWPQGRYRVNPVARLVEEKVEAIINLSASPWHLGKNETRGRLLSTVAKKSNCPVIYCNLVGGNDELIFDGSSLVYDSQGRLVAEGAMFAEDFRIIDTANLEEIKPSTASAEERVYRALVLGLRDYLHKCGFHSAVLGLSGGIDSAVVACLAVAALGPENVRGLSLPSQYSSAGSLEDAQALAANLGIQYDVVSIQESFKAVRKELAGIFAGRPVDTTEENIQARLRGVTLMAMSNKFCSLLLTTGNKSELAVGYCTLYGDMCGGLAVISDVPKTMVYRLARWINRDRPLIPEASLTKPPSAELRPNQTDQDTLPPYETLDAILEAYVEQGKTKSDIIAAGFDEAVVAKVVRLIETNEYKRRQAAPGLKVTSKAFGVGRRIPIAQKYRA